MDTDLSKLQEIVEDIKTKVGVPTPILLKAGPKTSTRVERDPAVSSVAFNSLHLFSCEYHPEGDSSTSRHASLLMFP